MTRIVVTTLKCDRCRSETQDPFLVGRFRVLTRWTQEGEHFDWDLCPDCWDRLQKFLDGTP